MSSARIHVGIANEEYRLLFGPSDQERLAKLGTVTQGVPTDTSDFIARLADTDILVASWSTPRLPDAPLPAGLRMVAYAAGSVRRLVSRDHIDRGLVVVQSAAAMAPSVAEMALTLTLVLLRHVHHHDRVMQTSGSWQHARACGLGRSLSGCRVGVVGASRSGREFVRMVRGLGAQAVRVSDPYLTTSEADELGVELASLDGLFASCDVVAIHAPATPETLHMVDGRILGLLADNAILINTARARVVEPNALNSELVSGRIRAGLDVFHEEPLPAESPLRELPNVVLVAHNAGATVDARAAQGRIAVDEIQRFISGDLLQHRVTSEIYDRLA